MQSFRDGIFLSQSQYIYDLLHRTQMTDCKPISTPMASKQPRLRTMDVAYPDVTEYRKIVGSL